MKVINHPFLWKLLTCSLKVTAHFKERGMEEKRRQEGRERAREIFLVLKATYY